MRFPWWRLAVWGLVACGSAPPLVEATAPADEASKTPSTPGAACIADANAERADIADPPRTITVRHVLVKHEDADGVDAGVTRTREEACLRALEAHEALLEGASFDEVVEDYSDEAGASTRGGLVGQVSRDEVEAAFGDVAFRLEPGQGSFVVETRKGFHIILRDR